MGHSRSVPHSTECSQELPGRCRVARGLGVSQSSRHDITTPDDPLHKTWSTLPWDTPITRMPSAVCRVWVPWPQPAMVHRCVRITKDRRFRSPSSLQLKLWHWLVDFEL